MGRIRFLDVISDRDRDRFFRNVEKTERCWLWTGHKSPKGYGWFGVFGDKYGAHRVSWVIHNGPIEQANLFVCHHCDTPQCVNPSHLFLGTNHDNVADRTAKSRTKSSGRGPITDEERRAIVAAYERGLIYSEIRSLVGVCHGTVAKALQGRPKNRRLKDWTPKLTTETAREIFLSTESDAALAAHHGVSPDLIQRVRAGRAWKQTTSGLVRP